MNADFKQRMRDEGALLAEFLREKMSISLIYATVQSVDKENKLINAVTDTQKVFSDIRLDVVPEGGNSVIFYPEVDSFVVLGFIENLPEQPFVVQFTKVEEMVISTLQDENSETRITQDEITVKRGDMSLKIDENAITLNGGELNGMVIVGKLTERLNKLQNEINSIQTAISSHTHTVATAGSSTSQTGSTTGTTYSRVTLTQVQDSDYENEKVLQ